MPTLSSVLPLYRQNICSSFGGCRRGAYGPMASKRENFRLSGPLHLTAVDWKNPHDRRSVAASLVRGVYVLERDRQQKRRGLRALAPPWWDFFHFKLVHVLVDHADLSIFGAVYEFKFPLSDCNYSVQNHPPTYVVAFRGLIPTPDIMSQDFNLYFHFIQNRLQQSNRFQLAMQSVQNMASVAGAANIWLAGHSMGSAIALLAGKNMGKAGYLIDTYLFNPPFISAAPTERIEDQNLKHGIRFLSSVITAGIAVAMNIGLHQRTQKENSFAVLSGWTPYLFVNPSDPICSEYIGYFQHRVMMMEVGAGEIARLATQISIESLLSGLEASHLLPSAYLTINLSPAQDFRQVHGIQQWWQPNIQCQFKLYQFNQMFS